MKLMIASDLHGSAAFTELLIRRYREEGAEKLILLGDLLYHGPRNDLPEGYAPKQVISLLSELAGQILCVRGNCEAEVDQMVLPFPVLAQYGWLRLGSRSVYITHGHLVNAEHPLAFSEGDILLMGHTHIPECRSCGCFTVLNPGSVSIPKEGTPHSCLVWEDGLFSWKDILSGEVYQVWQAE